MSAHILTRMARGERGLVYVPPTRHRRQPGKGAAKLGIPVEEYRAHFYAGERWCSLCKRWQPVAEFGRNRSRPDGLAGSCLDTVRQETAAKRNTGKG